MANFDDIFNSQPKEETEGQSFASFDKDEWAAQKKQERENAFALIDETAQLFDRIYVSAGQRGVQMIVDPIRLAEYVQATFADVTK